MLEWSSRRSQSAVRFDQLPRCMVAEAVNRASAEAAKTADPMRVDVVGESATSTIPAARASGAVAACSQPRRWGLTSSMTSRTCSPRCSATSVRAEWSRRSVIAPR